MYVKKHCRTIQLFVVIAMIMAWIMPSQAQYYIKRTHESPVAEEPNATTRTKPLVVPRKKSTVTTKSKSTGSRELSAIEIETGCTDKDLKTIQNIYQTMHKHAYVAGKTGELTKEEKEIARNSKKTERLILKVQSSQTFSTMMSKCAHRPGFFQSLAAAN